MQRLDPSLRRRQKLGTGSTDTPNIHFHAFTALSARLDAFGPQNPRI